MKAVRRGLSLDEKIVVDILSRLPTPDLCRCKCVCKDWRCRLVPWALSLRPDLAFAHINKKGVWVPRFLSFSDEGSVRDELFSSPSFYAIFEAPVTKAQVLAACNGMVLCCTGYPPRRSRVGLPNPRRTVSELVDYVLLNPVTRQVSIIPPPPGMRFNSLFNFLVFDPRASAHHFMVITMEFSDLPNPFLYSSRTGEWRPLEVMSQIQLSKSEFIDPMREDCYCVNGTCYKIAGAASSKSGASAEYLVWENIMAFDVKKECLFWFTSPVVTKEKIGYAYRSIGESAGHLSYAYLAPKRSLSIWALNDCRSGEWIFTHKVDLSDTPPLREILSLFCFHPVDADLIFVSFFGPLFLVNLKTLELRELAHGEELCLGSLSPYVCPK